MLCWSWTPLVPTLLRSQSPLLIHQPSSLSLELMSIGYCQSVYSRVSGQHLTILTNSSLKQSLPLGFMIWGFLHSLPSSMVTASKTLFPPPLPLSTFTPSVTCSISILLAAIALQTKNSKFLPPAKLLLLSSDYTDRRLRGFLEYRDGKASGKLGGVGYHRP